MAPSKKPERLRAKLIRRKESQVIEKGDQARAYAKELYFRYYTQELIAKMANVSYGGLKKWIYVGTGSDPIPWRDQRTTLETERLKAIAEEKLPLITEITGLTMVALRDGLQEYIKRGEAASLSELAQLSGILERSYKFGALATGNPTEIAEIRPTKTIKNMEDARAVMTEHPFFSGPELDITDTDTEDPTNDAK